MLAHIKAGQSLSQRVVCPASCFALGHEITMLQKLRSVLLQKPLDRSRTRLVWSDVDVTDALCHALTPQMEVPHKLADQSSSAQVLITLRISFMRKNRNARAH
jgi:hypothetical protein